jgi:hypothetical protein
MPFAYSVPYTLQGLQQHEWRFLTLTHTLFAFILPCLYSLPFNFPFLNFLSILPFSSLLPLFIFPLLRTSADIREGYFPRDTVHTTLHSGIHLTHSQLNWTALAAFAGMWSKLICCFYVLCGLILTESFFGAQIFWLFLTKTHRKLKKMIDKQPASAF